MPLIIKSLKLPDTASFDLEFNENGLYGIIGRNGIGKSTLFSVISGEIAHSIGTITSCRVAYLPDVESFDENLSAKDYFSILSDDEKSEALRLTAFFSANSFYQKKIENYSLGMKELFATILCFSMQCEVLIIDELFSGLDVAIKVKVYQVLKEFSKTHIVLLTSHDLREIEHFCQTTFLLSEKGLTLVTDFQAAKKEIGYMELF